MSCQGAGSIPTDWITYPSLESGCRIGQVLCRSEEGRYICNLYVPTQMSIPRGSRHSPQIARWHQEYVLCVLLTRTQGNPGEFNEMRSAISI